MEASVGAGWALPFPIDHSDIESIVTVRLQPRQHAVSLAALEGEDLLLNVASVPFRGALSLPVVNLKWQEPKSRMHRKSVEPCSQNQTTGASRTQHVTALALKAWQPR